MPGSPVLFLGRQLSAGTTQVALICPPAVIFPKSLSYVGPVPPLGIAYLASVLREAGHEPQVIDAPGEALGTLTDFETEAGTMRRIGLSPAEVVERIHPGTSIIGIGHMFLHEWPHAREIARLARARFPDALILLGGENASAYWPWIFEQCAAVDAVVRGEGELTLVEIANRVADGQGLADLALLDGVVVNPQRREAVPEPGAKLLPSRIRHLESIPRPAWDLIPLENYWEQGSYLGVDRGRSMPLMATRGCPYKCSFCSSPQMWTTRYVVREPKDLVDEIEEYVNRYGIRNVDFCDLTAITKRNWTLSFCDELERRNLDLTWQLPIGTRSECLDREVLQRMYDTGCRNITYAPESGSPRLLEHFDKRLDLDHLKQSMRDAREIGYSVHMNSIIGHPKETFRDLALTWKLFVHAALAGCETAAPIMFCAYPGSADFNDLLEAGRIVPDERYVYVGLTRGASGHESYNPRYSDRQLHWAQLGIVSTFYALAFLLHPGRFVRLLRAQLRPGQERDNLEMAIRIKRRSRRTRREHRDDQPRRAA
jgi:radical SAM superfamily enzyme YgiQ (UPF0313 family)